MGETYLAFYRNVLLLRENKHDMYNNGKRGYPLLVVLMAVIVVFGLSFVPWTEITGGFMKDFDLLEDISDRTVDRGETDEIIDPLLAAEMSSVSLTETVDTVPEAETVDTVTGTPYEARRIDGVVVMEDYAPQQRGFERLRAALAHSGSRQVRIGVIGDSYIEGDILTQDIRERLQSLYGGRGVGYVPMTSEVSGFRRSVRQTDSGWTEHDLRTDKSIDCRWLSGQRFTGGPGATATWRAARQPAHAQAWNSARVALRTSSPGTITVQTGTDAPQTVSLNGSDSPQVLDFKGEMSKFTLTNNSVADLTVYGVWLSDTTGVVVDGMSLRGNSGIVHSSLSPDLTAAMGPGVDYDLIVLEYGLNAVTSRQKDYSYYAGRMAKVIGRLRECYPDADIIVMGAGDRGQKSGTTVHSMATVQSMVNAQRALARDAGVVFWDTRAAMGGDNAIVAWRQAKEVNADYIHLNFDGGRHLADLFVDALTLTLDNR